MLIADIKGKLSLRELHREDFLTSSVFSAFMYLDEKWIQKYINQAINLRGEELSVKLNNLEYQFWPYFGTIKGIKGGVEPDVIIYSENVAIIIEAKYLSGKSGVGVFEEDAIEDLGMVDLKKIADQLGRQYFVGKNSILNSTYVLDEKALTIDNFVLIFLTRHATFPKDEIEESIASIIKMNPKEKMDAEQKIFWLNWQKAMPIFEEMVETKPKNSFEYKISKDMVDFLELRNLGLFSGFNFLDDFCNFIGESKEAFTKKYLFYRKVFKPYWKFLSNIRPFTRTRKDTVFYNIVHLPYWSFIKNDLEYHEDSIFYKIIEKPYWEFISLDFDYDFEKEIFYKE